MNVKQGDLAWIVNCPQFPQNLGAIVRVGAQRLYAGRWYWNVISTGRLLTGSLHPGNRVEQVRTALCLDEYLKRMHGEFEHETPTDVIRELTA